MNKTPIWSAEDIERRESEVVGDAPRIPPLKLEEFSDEALDITVRLTDASSSGRQKGSLEDVPEIIPTMLRHPGLWSVLVDFGVMMLSGGEIPPRDRELVVLRTGWLYQAPYEFGEHVNIAKRVGITSEEIERVTQEGSSSPKWSEHERVLLRAVEELFEDTMISDGTWETLSQVYDEKQLIELPVLFGHFQTVACFQNTLRLRLEGQNKGLKSR